MPLAEGVAGEASLDASLLVARKFKSHIEAAFIRADPNTAGAALPEAGGDLAAYTASDEIVRQSPDDERQRFESWRVRNGVPTDAAAGQPGHSANWSEQIGDIETIVTRLGRVNDLIIVQRPTSAALAAQRCFDAALFGSGRPALILPEGKVPQHITDHIMIAWNGSIEATRAVAFAMPFLHSARRVTIFTALEYGVESGGLGDLAGALRWHGIRTPEVIFPDKAASTGAALMAAAETQGATMVVMGAYTHSRLRQRLLGGVTEYVLSHSPIPLLMCR